MELWLESQSNNAAMQGGFNDEEMTGGGGLCGDFQLPCTAHCISRGQSFLLQVNHHLYSRFP